MESLKELVYKAREYNPLSVQTKGYMFDSLVYRFKDYQSKAFQAEVNDYKYKHNTVEMDARKIINDRHTRDLIRFIEILDEAIGEHD